jgi:hypothetical protein
MTIMHAGMFGTLRLLCCFIAASNPKDTVMVIGVAHIAPIVALIAGILILLVPRLLNLIVAIYLIFIGLVGLGVLDKLGVH